MPKMQIYQSQVGLGETAPPVASGVQSLSITGASAYGKAGDALGQAFQNIAIRADELATKEQIYHWRGKFDISYDAYKQRSMEKQAAGQSSEGIMEDYNNFIAAFQSEYANADLTKTAKRFLDEEMAVARTNSRFWPLQKSLERKEQEVSDSIMAYAMSFANNESIPLEQRWATATTAIDDAEGKTYAEKAAMKAALAEEFLEFEALQIAATEGFETANEWLSSPKVLQTFGLAEATDVKNRLSGHRMEALRVAQKQKDFIDNKMFEMIFIPEFTEQPGGEPLTYAEKLTILRQNREDLGDDRYRSYVDALLNQRDNPPEDFVVESAVWEAIYNIPTERRKYFDPENPEKTSERVQAYLDTLKTQIVMGAGRYYSHAVAREMRRKMESVIDESSARNRPEIKRYYDVIEDYRQSGMLCDDPSKATEPANKLQGFKRKHDAYKILDKIIDDAGDHPDLMKRLDAELLAIEKKVADGFLEGLKNDFINGAGAIGHYTWEVGERVGPTRESIIGELPPALRDYKPAQPMNPEDVYGRPAE